MGFMVTYINHCKDVVRLFKDLGAYRVMHFMYSIAGNFINPLITPLLFVIWVRSYFFGYAGETYLELLPHITLIGNLILIISIHLISSIRFSNTLQLLVIRSMYSLFCSVVRSGNLNKSANPMIPFILSCKTLLYIIHFIL